jgi:hypothetical protein
LGDGKNNPRTCQNAAHVFTVSPDLVPAWGAQFGISWAVRRYFQASSQGILRMKYEIIGRNYARCRISLLSIGVEVGP